MFLASLISLIVETPFVSDALMGGTKEWLPVGFEIRDQHSCKKMIEHKQNGAYTLHTCIASVLLGTCFKSV